MVKYYINHPAKNRELTFRFCKYLIVLSLPSPLDPLSHVLETDTAFDKLRPRQAQASSSSGLVKLRPRQLTHVKHVRSCCLSLSKAILLAISRPRETWEMGKSMFISKNNSNFLSPVEFFSHCFPVSKPVSCIHAIKIISSCTHGVFQCNFRIMAIEQSSQKSSNCHISGP